jgi:hypothetical protein
MKVQLDGGEVIDLGAAEETPTISIVDYSRRVTDDFGVTTVVPRNFSRRMSVRMEVPFEQADAVQRRLADLRATAAMWIADERFSWLSFRGFYKDFTLDLATPPVSYCTLTIEGLAGNEPFVDPGGDPAPDGSDSTLRLLQPIVVTPAALLASSVDENDYSEWAGDIAYPLGARVIKAASHRIYESAADANLGNDPIGISGKWTDIGPTNRWAMFDQALGSITAANGLVEVTVDVGPATALALLDVTVGTTVHVEAPGYARTAAPSPGGVVTFLDLPGVAGSVTVTIVGSGTVSVGTMLIGSVVGLGITEASPTAALTDYSRKEVDDFGEVTIVQRAYAKRMSAKALIATDAIDIVAGRIAAVRALPSLWIGDSDLDSLTIYGFFKDFSIEAGSAVSKLSLLIEGLSTAGKVEPLGAIVNWPDIADPDGTKPEDNATNGAPGNSPVGNSTGNAVVDGLAAARELADRLLVTIGEIPDGATVESELDRLDVAVGEASAAIQEARRVAASDTNAVAERVETVEAKFTPGGVVPTAVARIEEVAQAAAADNQSVAQRATNLEAAVGGPGGLMARTSTVETVAADAYGRVAGASLTQTAIAGDGRAEVAIFAYTADGVVISGIRLTGDVEIIGNLLVSESVTTGKLAPNAASSINYFFSSTPSSTSETTNWTDLYMGGARVQVASFVPATGGIALLDAFYSSGTSEGSIGWTAAVRIVRHDGKVFVPAQELGGQGALRVIDEAPIANVVNTYFMQTAKGFYTGGQASDIIMYNALLTADLRKR